MSVSFRQALHSGAFSKVVIVSALGYFVDIYDLVLFSIVRVASLKSLNIPPEQILDVGVYLLNMQMTGMLLGGILWGMLGDKRGRISVLFGSIFLYSTANILNAFVQDVTQYGILRFIAGLGLAGELGAAITLVTESLPKETRGYGTTVVTTVGVFGAVVAALIGENFSWQTAYIIGGCLGLSLLLLRVGLLESDIFKKTKISHVKRGDIFLLVHPTSRFLRYLKSILIGVPIWFVIGILVTFSPEISRSLSVQGEISAGRAIMFSYLGLVLGDFASGLLSQMLRSRKKAAFAFLTLTTLLILVYLNAHQVSTFTFYLLCLLLGFGSGYWAVFITSAAEQFGTNLRATVATTAPNFVRGAVVLLTGALQTLKTNYTLLESVTMLAGATLSIALISLYSLEETFHKDLDYYE